MKTYASDLWQRCGEALRVAENDLAVSPDAAASRAYYAAFYAVSALFALGGQTFRTHSGVETAVHRDLVKPGTWPVPLGADYSALVDLREKGDYGGGEHVTARKRARPSMLPSVSPRPSGRGARNWNSPEETQPTVQHPCVEPTVRLTSTRTIPSPEQ